MAGSQAAEDLEEGLWLYPIEYRRGLESESGRSREGIVEEFSLGS